METFNVGDTVDGKYQITKVLGQGGMGLVVAASRPGLSKLVALKVLLPELRANRDVATRFAREARAGDTLRSEHVARVLDVGTTPAGTPYIVMEHLEGQDLAHVLGERGRLPLAEAADLLLQACEAIGEAHTHGIVHRDLKPGNLFVTTSVDGLPFVKVLDFGISKTRFPDDTVITETGAVFGSARYMSPEQLASLDVDARSDVWALGVILYEMLGGTPPFAGDTFPVVCAEILSGRYTALSAREVAVPAEVDALVTEALEGKRESRLPSVEAFARKLAPFGTSAARQSYERIARVSGGVKPAEIARPDATFPPLPETAPGVKLTRAGADSRVEKSEEREKSGPPPMAKRPRPGIARFVSLVGVASLVVAGGVFGSRYLKAASPATKTPRECADGATPACEAACTAHVPGGCEALASALMKGKGAPRDVARAEKIFQAECDAHAGSACNALGVHYASDAPKEPAKAVALYKRGCEGESLTACVNLGGMHYTGDGVPKNETLGVSYFLRGCPSRGPVEPQGCVNLSVAYLNGLGVPKDPSQSVAYAKKACENGARRGCTIALMAKVTGEGAPKDVQGALTELEGNCAQGEPSACAQLIALFIGGLGADVPPNPARARAVAEEGCRANDPQSCAVKSVFEQADNSETTVAQSNAQLETSCNAGVLRDCGYLGERALGGQGMPADRARGVALLDRACKGSVARACEKLREATGGGSASSINSR